MKKFSHVAILSVATLFLAACEGDDGQDGADGADGADGLNSLVAIRDIPRGDAVCLGGGLALDSGLDSNRNDVLDPEEVTATELLE
jgi:alkaline phosphatase